MVNLSTQHVRKGTSLVDIITWLVFVGVGVVVFIGLYAFWFVARLELPSIDNFEERRVEQSTQIYDRTGEVLLYNIHGDVRRTVVPFNEMPLYLRNATVAIEDATFYQHAGVRPLRTLKAVWDNITSGDLGGQGGSTLTQQVVKNIYLSNEKTITRKIKEWILAIALEKRFTKDEILSVYLNEMPYGGTIYGAQEASKYFFGKDVADITLAEAAYLAALPQRPSYLSPHGEHTNELDARKNLVLHQMLENGFITTQEYDTARTEEVSFNKFMNNSIILAPHFVFFIRDYLIEKYGEETVYEEGLKVTTTINADMQRAAEDILKEYATRNEEDFNAENAALVAIDPKTGQILSMVGSRDYFDETIDGKFNVATAHRQPGSTFKPIVYGTAFERGFTPSTVVFDLQTQFSSTCAPDDFTTGNGCYAPVNYDGEFRGPMILRNALAQSINIPAVKLLYMTGIPTVLEKAHALGIESLDLGANHYGLSLVLGGGEVTPLELTNAYATFANDGVFNKAIGILQIENSEGEILEEFTASPERALSEQAVRQLNSVLSDNVARAPAYGQGNFLVFNRDVAGKTGTTNDFRDVWVVGYTPTLAVGTWAGNNDNSPIVKKVAGFVIAPMWRTFMDQALPLVEPESFIDPEPIPNDVLPIHQGDWQTAFSTSGQSHSILHFIDVDNPSQTPQTPSRESLYTNWEYPVQLWAQTIGLSSSTVSNLPTAPQAPQTQPTYTPAHSFTITYPQHKSTVRAGTPLTINVTPHIDLNKVEYYINGAYIGASVGTPYSITIVPERRSWPTTIRAVGHLGSVAGGTVVSEISVNTQ